MPLYKIGDKVSLTDPQTKRIFVGEIKSIEFTDKDKNGKEYSYYGVSIREPNGREFIIYVSDYLLHRVYTPGGGGRRNNKNYRKSKKARRIRRRSTRRN